MNTNMAFTLAYTADENKIATALQKGKIDTGDMILVLDSTDDNYGNLVVINKESEQVKVSSAVRKFISEQDAELWLEKMINKPVGEIISIAKDGLYDPYMVNINTYGEYVFTPIINTTGVISVNNKTGVVKLTPDDIGAINKTGDTMTGNLNMGDNFITNVAEPINSSDVATKGYVDTQITKAVPQSTVTEAGKLLAVDVEGSTYWTASIDAGIISSMA